MHEFKTKTFDVWLGKENEDLIDDIKAVYKKGETVYGYYYDLRLADVLSFVNYRITPTTDYEDDEVKSRSQENLTKKFENPKGIIIEIEVLDSDTKIRETVGRYTRCLKVFASISFNRVQPK